MHRLFLSFTILCTLLCGFVNSQAYNPYNYFNNVRKPQADGFIFPDSFSRLSATQQPSLNRENAQYNSNERISLRKCREYGKLVSKSVSIGTLSIDAPKYSISTDECENSQGLIVGGVDAAPGEFPHMAAIGLIKNNEKIFGCGGSLISEKFVLTAAHCRKIRPTFVRLGDHNLKVIEYLLPENDYSIETFISHENYNPRSKKHDIALIKVRGNVAFSKHVRPACLMQSDNQIRNKKGIASGWGLTDGLDLHSTSDVLQRVEINFVDTRTCSTFYESEGYSIDDTQLCAGENGKDACRGDSGGPLQVPSENSQCVYIIAGITSFGSQGCGGSGAVGVYTKVLPYLDWIEKKVWG